MNILVPSQLLDTTQFIANNIYSCNIRSFLFPVVYICKICHLFTLHITVVPGTASMNSAFFRTKDWGAFTMSTMLCIIAGTVQKELQTQAAKHFRHAASTDEATRDLCGEHDSVALAETHVEKIHTHSAPCCACVCSSLCAPWLVQQNLVKDTNLPKEEF